jgi:hypothetical protein
MNDSKVGTYSNYNKNLISPLRALQWNTTHLAKFVKLNLRETYISYPSMWPMVISFNYLHVYSYLRLHE